MNFHITGNVILEMVKEVIENYIHTQKLDKWNKINNLNYKIN